MNSYIKIFFLAFLATLSSCGDKYLDLQQEKNQRVPNSIEDFQKLLYQTNAMNEADPMIFANIGADEFWITDAQWLSTTGLQPALFQKNAYIWSDDIYLGGETNTGWDNAYKAVYRTNLSLDFISKTPRTNENGKAWDELKGSALFMRAFTFYQLAQVYCPAYSEENVNSPYGLPLRDQVDPTVNVPRSTLGDTYKKIIDDIQLAIPLLDNKGENVYRSSKAAAFALLSRVYMAMGDYALAEKAADDCLGIQNEILDFNAVPITAGAAMTFKTNAVDNPEVIYMSSSALTTLLNWARPDTNLVRSYEDGDMRMQVYFQDTTQVGVSNLTAFKGNYKGTNNATPFTGLATDEIYLNRAEARAMNNNLTGALADLNLIRKNRFSPEVFAELQSIEQEQVLRWVMLERRKELLMRGTRWSDLKRYNKEEKYATSIIRRIGEETYELKPGSDKWVWPIMLEAISMGGYIQNPR